LLITVRRSVALVGERTTFVFKYLRSLTFLNICDKKNEVSASLFMLNLVIVYLELIMSSYTT
jgi:hypothetical protein